LQGIMFTTVTGTPEVGEEISQLLTIDNPNKIATGFIASYDKETKVLKYFRDRSLYFNETTKDQTDRVGIDTSGRIFQFESSSSVVKGKTSNFSGNVDTSQNTSTTNPSGNKLINLGVNFTNGLSESEINKGSGEVIYLDNRPEILRNSRQKEDIKIILEF